MWISSFLSYKALLTSISKFSLLVILIFDNGKQFSNNNFMDFCTNLGIKQRFTSIKHPQSNDQVELKNRIMLDGIKKKLNEAKGR